MSFVLTQEGKAHTFNWLTKPDGYRISLPEADPSVITAGNLNNSKAYYSGDASWLANTTGANAIFAGYDVDDKTNIIPNLTTDFAITNGPVVPETNVQSTFTMRLTTPPNKFECTGTSSSTVQGALVSDQLTGTESADVFISAQFAPVAMNNAGDSITFSFNVGIVSV